MHTSNISICFLYAHFFSYYLILSFRAYLRKQLEEWRRQGTDQKIDQERLKLYVLLSGEVVWEMSREERRERGVVNVCEGLDWKRVLALHLCYICTPSSDISAAITTYLHSYQVYPLV